MRHSDLMLTTANSVTTAVIVGYIVVRHMGIRDVMLCNVMVLMHRHMMMARLMVMLRHVVVPTMMGLMLLRHMVVMSAVVMLRNMMVVM